MADKDNELVTTTEALPVELTEEQREKIKQALNQESEELLVRLSKTKDVQETKDLTYLFMLNNSKKAMMRQNKINTLVDNAVDELSDRVENHSDEIDHDTMIKILTTAQGILDKNTATAAQSPEKNLIQINKTETTINVNSDQNDEKKLTSQQRKNIDSVVSKILGGVIKVNEEPAEEVILEADVTEIKEPEDGSKK